MRLEKNGQTEIANLLTIISADVVNEREVQ